MNRSSAGPADPLTGPVVEWICSGVPTVLAVPAEVTTDLLAAHGLLLFPDEPVNPEPRTRCRQVVGHVTRHPEVLRLALSLADLLGKDPLHPMVLAARWIEAGYSPEAVTSQVAAGVRGGPVPSEGVMKPA
ncbi:MAG: hypothetical protein ACRDTC_28700 [Pseudonocardiaceae bacterium]